MLQERSSAEGKRPLSGPGTLSSSSPCTIRPSPACKQLRKDIDLRQTEPFLPWRTRVELSVDAAHRIRSDAFISSKLCTTQTHLMDNWAGPSLTPLQSYTLLK